jgi:hypothetical protein
VYWPAGGKPASSLSLKPLPALRLPPGRSAEARRWQEGVEQQAGTISELQVEAEAERRRRRGLERELTAAQGEQAAAKADVAALLGQLRAAEGAANAAEGVRLWMLRLLLARPLPLPLPAALLLPALLLILLLPVAVFPRALVQARRLQWVGSWQWQRSSCSEPGGRWNG